MYNVQWSDVICEQFISTVGRTCDAVCDLLAIIAKFLVLCIVTVAMIWQAFYEDFFDYQDMTSRI